MTGIIVLAVTPLLGGSTRMAFLALGLTLPGLLLQDSWRFAFFAHGRGALALVNDTVWAIALVAGFVILRATGHETVFWARLRLGRLGRRRRGARRRSRRESLPRLARDSPMARDALGPRTSVPGRGHHQQRLDAVGHLRRSALLLGLAAVGAVQAASLLMGPYMVVISGMGLVLLPEAVRILRVSPPRLPHLCVLISVAFSALAAAWGIALLIVLPMGLGEALLGSLWRPTYPLVLPTDAVRHGLRRHRRRRPRPARARCGAPEPAGLDHHVRDLRRLFRDRCRRGGSGRCSQRRRRRDVVRGVRVLVGVAGCNAHIAARSVTIEIRGGRLEPKMAELQRLVGQVDQESVYRAGRALSDVSSHR